MKLSVLNEDRSHPILVVVHPNYIVDKYALADKFDLMEKYFNKTNKIINGALSKDFYVIVTWLRHGHVEWREGGVDEYEYISIDDGDYVYDDVEAASKGGWTGTKWSMVGVKNKELYHNFLDELSSKQDDKYQFLVERVPGDSIEHSVIPSLDANTKVLVAGGHRNACVAKTVEQIKKFLPRVRLMVKYIY